MRRFLILGGLLTILFPTVIFAEFNPEIIENAKSAIVAIYIDENLENLVGSGFFIDSYGNILTNKHVITYPKLWARLYDNRKFELEVSAFLFEKDLAILKPVIFRNLDQSLLYLKFAVPYYMCRGKNVLAIGHSSRGLWNIIKGTTKDCGRLSNGTSTIKYSPTILKGFSGSPLINEDGLVIGINTLSGFGYKSIYSEYLFSEAIDLNEIKTFVLEFYKNSNIPSALLSKINPRIESVKCVWIFTSEGRWCRQ